MKYSRKMIFRSKRSPLALLLLASLPAVATAESKPDTAKSEAGSKGSEILPEMTVSGETETPPVQSATEKYKLPVVTESVTKEKLADTVNMMNTEDAIKYLPNILVRKRYIGDKEMPVAMRTSGTGASARNLIYADGILLSSLLGNNNSMTGSPRWNMISPSEIERVDVMYGPFAAAHAGNSIGGVIDITTRMPDKFEAGGGVQSSWQEYDQYGSKDWYDSQQYTANLGSRHGDFAWRFDVSHLDAHSQPITYSTIARSSTAASPANPVVTGAVPDFNRLNQPIQVLGEGNIRHTIQDNFKWKLAYDITPTLRASYTLGLWTNDEHGGVNSYLRNAAGNPFYSGNNVNIGGNRYNIGATTFAENDYQQMHWAHGMTLKSNTGGIFDWELIGSVFHYGEDVSRAPTVPPAQAAQGGAGRITYLTDTGWHTADAKGIWRPTLFGPHSVSFGYHHDLYELNNPVYTTNNWLNGPNGTLFTDSRGKTQTEAFWIQDAWSFHPQWTFTLGGRLEYWNAYDGLNVSGGRTLAQADRDDLEFSPKASLSWTPTDRWKLTSSIAQAYRFPTVTELFQVSVPAAANLPAANPNPDLKPEEALSSELSAQYFLDEGSLRVSLFHERVHDAIYSQLNVPTNTNFIQNIDKISTYGVEFSGESRNVGIAGLDLSGNFTWADSRIDENAAYPFSVGKKQPRVPEWRASATATYRFTDKFSSSVSGRYSSRQYGQVDNLDVNTDTYQGTGSSYFVVDTRMRYQLTKQWSVAAGIDNITNEKYWLFHIFPQRSYFAELKFNY